MLSSIIDILINNQQAFLRGLGVTLKLAGMVWFFGIIFGTLLGWLGASFKKTIGRLSWIIAFLLSGVPVLVFLFWLHYPAQSLAGVVIDPFYTALLTFSLINIFSVSELVRYQVNEFPKQYLLAAQVCGLSKKETLIKIQLPIILRQVLPSLLMLQVTMLHVTLFASLISVEELFRVAQKINSQIYQPVEIYSALGLFFLAISLPMNGLALWLKSHFTRNLSEK